jgi:hypothetical protein
MSWSQMQSKRPPTTFGCIFLLCPSPSRKCCSGPLVYRGSWSVTLLNPFTLGSLQKLMFTKPIVTAATYFLSGASSRYSSLPQVENASEKILVDLPAFAHRFGLKTSRWLSTASVSIVASISSLAILVNSGLILSPVNGASAFLFLVAQTIVYLLLPLVSSSQLLSTHNQGHTQTLD